MVTMLQFNIRQKIKTVLFYLFFLTEQSCGGKNLPGSVELGGSDKEQTKEYTE